MLAASRTAILNKHSAHHVLGLFAQSQVEEPYLAQGDDDAIFEYVLDELDELFDGQASQLYIKRLVQNWMPSPTSEAPIRNARAQQRRRRHQSQTVSTSTAKQ